jgi:D-sedoheptulose 7-phosphate isomerase
MTDMNSGSGPEFAREYVEHLIAILRGLDFAAVGRVTDLFLEARSAGNTIFFLGNGGSAATACHFANDFRFCASPRAHLSLLGTANSALSHAWSTSVMRTFSWQLRNLMRPVT